MTPLQKTAAGLSCVALLSPALLLGASPKSDFYGRVICVYAGDQLEVMHQGRREHIRLYGVRCPPGAYGAQAKQLTRTLAEFRGVHIHPFGPDRHGNTVVQLHFLAGKDLAHELLSAGLARWDTSAAPHDAVLPRLELQARQARRGLWAETTTASRRDVPARS